MTEWTLGAVLDAIAEVIPDRVMTVCGDRRSTFAEAADRTRRLANFLTANGYGGHRERDTLHRWECGQDRVALIMRNDLYPDAVIGCLKARTVPVNVNYHYSPREIRELLAYVRPRAVIYHCSLGARFAEVLPPEGSDLLISVEDGSDVPALPGSVSFDDVLAQGDRDRAVPSSPDDLLMICTGGTTGRPKAVLWRQGDIYVVAMNGADHDGVAEIHEKVGRAGPPWYAVSPLMHAAGFWTAFAGFLSGQTVILNDCHKFDAAAVLRTAQRERIGLMTMVGDAYVAPLIDELARGDYDLSALFAIGTGGAATNAKHRQALLAQLPRITLIDGYGSSETGNVGFAHSQLGRHSGTFEFRAGGRLVAHDYSRFVQPGEPEVGWVARQGRIPLGYFDDRVATQETFPEVEGCRVMISGDRASLGEDGRMRLFGRDSQVVNTGGEKVFVEEVEEALRAHPDVADAVVVGRPSDRWGEEIVAVVQVRDGAGESREGLRDHCAAHLAGFKVPKDVTFVTAVRRLGNGKADYRWAKDIAVREQVSATEDRPTMTRMT